MKARRALKPLKPLKPVIGPRVKASLITEGFVVLLLVSVLIGMLYALGTS
jgi:hypothetical protein